MSTTDKWRPGGNHSAIEKATEASMHDLNEAITRNHRAHGVPTSENEFRRILALYLADKTEEDWCRTLGIPTPQKRQTQ